MTVALLLRGAMIWLLLRFAVGATAGLSSRVHHASAFTLTAAASAAVVLLAGTLGLLEARRRYEDRFLANLGVSPAAIALLSMAPALVIEIGLAVALPR